MLKASCLLPHGKTGGVVRLLGRLFARVILENFVCLCMEDSMGRLIAWNVWSVSAVSFPSRVLSGSCLLPVCCSYMLRAMHVYINYFRSLGAGPRISGIEKGTGSTDQNTRHTPTRARHVVDHSAGEVADATVGSSSTHLHLLVRVGKELVEGGVEKPHGHRQAVHFPGQGAQHEFEKSLQTVPEASASDKQTSARDLTTEKKQRDQPKARQAGDGGGRGGARRARVGRSYRPMAHFRMGAMSSL